MGAFFVWLFGLFVLIFFLICRINWPQNHNMLSTHKPGSVKIIKLELSGTCGGPSTTPAFRDFDYSHLLYLSFSYYLNIHEHLPLQDQLNLKYFIYVVTILTSLFINMNMCTAQICFRRAKVNPGQKSNLRSFV